MFEGPLRRRESLERADEGTKEVDGGREGLAAREYEMMHKSCLVSNSYALPFLRLKSYILGVVKAPFMRCASE